MYWNQKMQHYSLFSYLEQHFLCSDYVSYPYLYSKGFWVELFQFIHCVLSLAHFNLKNPCNHALYSLFHFKSSWAVVLCSLQATGQGWQVKYHDFCLLVNRLLSFGKRKALPTKRFASWCFTEFLWLSRVHSHSRYCTSVIWAVIYFTYTFVLAFVSLFWCHFIQHKVYLHLA